MQQLVNFFIKNKNFLLFLILFALAFFLTVQSHSYQKSKFTSSANFVSGTIYSWSYGIEQYFELENRNDRLKLENQKLRNALEGFRSNKRQHPALDSSAFAQPFTFRSAEVIANRYSHTDNYLLVNLGKSNGIQADQGVITDDGVVGIVEHSTAHYSRVISILNSKVSISARLKNSHHFGSLTWNGDDPNTVQLIDIPRLAPVKKGDSIVTNGRSFIFPEGIPIGKITDFKLDQSNSYYKIDINLFNDMTSLGFVYIIENNNRKELDSIDLQDGK